MGEDISKGPESSGAYNQLLLRYNFLSASDKMQPPPYRPCMDKVHGLNQFNYYCEKSQNPV
jgi:hypothetical protein